MHDRLARIEAIVHEALCTASAQREALLDRLCGGEPSLRQEVESLLAYEGRASAFLDQPALGRRSDDKAFAGRSFMDSEPPLDLDFDPDLNRTIGSYRLVERIGTGGMGKVYRARRSGGEFHQTVAIKLIRHGWCMAGGVDGAVTGEDVVQRFRLERQILANLNHPNIARLIDGGSTDDGRPFIVMEEVRGERIDRYCDTRRLTIRQRIELFRTVCDAVQYAHRNLVVHRDLKPSNVLVADDKAGGSDATPRVKLLDFGIAKVLAPDGAEASASAATINIDRTRTGSNRLTPAYASPEQVRASTITTASDVYSLGVILYELLSGRKPYDFGTGSAAEMERAICETPPTRLWTAIEQTERTGQESGGEEHGDDLPVEFGPPASDLSAISAARSTDAARLRRTLSGDLEKIVLMALRKEPERRYATVEALSADLRRYLDGWPVMAQGDSWGYRARKFLARHRAGVLGAAGAAAGLALATIISAAAMIAARQAQSTAEVSRHTASVVSSYLKDMLASIDPAVAQGRDVSLLRDVLDQTSERLRTELGDSPREAAELHEAVGAAYHAIGEYASAEAHLARAVELYLNLADQDEGEADRGLRLAAALHARARALHELNQRDEAEQVLLKALAIRRERLGPDHPLIGATLAMQGNIVFSAGEYERGETLLREGIDILRQATSDRSRATKQATLAADSSLVDSDASLKLALALRWLATLLNDQRRPSEAEPLLFEARAMFVAAHGERHPVIAQTEEELAHCYRRMGGPERLQQAAAHYQNALQIDRQLLSPDHPTMGYRLNGYASVLEDIGRIDEAIVNYVEAERILRASIGEGTTEYGTLCNNLGNLYAKQGWHEDAIPLLQRAIDVYTNIRGSDDMWVSFPLLNLARVHFQSGDRAEELRCADEALRIRLLHLPENDELVDLARVFRADGLIVQGEPAALEQAEEELLAAYQRMLDRRGEAHEGAKLIRSVLANLCEAHGRHEEAARWRER